MATLKYTSSSDSEAISKDHALQLYKNNLLNAASYLIDLEAMYHECLKGGVSLIDHNIIHRCKISIGKVFNDLGLFNTYVYADIDAEVEKAKNMAAPNAKFLKFTNRPRVKIGFNPRAKSYFDESEDNVNESNNRALSSVDEINKLIAETPILTANAVRRKYTVAQDGYLIHLMFADLSDSEAVLERIGHFIGTVEALSLDELMISQQFSEWFTVEQSNPFSLELIANSSENAELYDQSIAITVFNLNDYTASFYLSTILKNIKQRITNYVLVSDSLSMKYHKHSINNSYECVNLHFPK